MANKKAIYIMGIKNCIFIWIVPYSNTFETNLSKWMADLNWCGPEGPNDQDWTWLSLPPPSLSLSLSPPSLFLSLSPSLSQCVCVCVCVQETKRDGGIYTCTVFRQSAWQHIITEIERKVINF